MRGLIRMLLTAFCCLAATSALGAERVGRIVTVQGAPKVERADGGVIELKRNDPIHLGDRLDTGNGRVKIMFEDNTLMTLSEGTELEVTEYLYDPQKNERDSMLDLVKGKVKSLVGSIFSSSSNFRVRTPTAVAGVRGTHWQVEHRDRTHVTVFEGEVAVESVGGELLKLTRGMQVGAGSSGFLGRPRQLNDRQLQQKRNELTIRSEERLKQQANKSVDHSNLAKDAVQRLDTGRQARRGGGARGRIRTDDDTRGADDAGGGNPLDQLESVDPRIQGNVRINLRFPEEQSP